MVDICKKKSSKAPLPIFDTKVSEVWTFPDDYLVSTSMAAEMLVRSPNTLKKWRHLGEGPSYIRGRPVLYRIGSLKSYSNEMEVQ